MKIKKNIWKKAIIGFIIGIIISILYIIGGFKLLDNLVFDIFFRLRAVQPADNRIVIIAVDDNTLASQNLGQWSSWTRENYIKLLKILNKAYPKVIGFNILLSDPSKRPEYDIALTKLLAESNNVVMPVGYIYSNPPSYLFPYSVFTKNSYSVGHTASLQDIDGITRQIEAQIKINNKAYWNFAIEIVAKYLNVNSSKIFIKNNYLYIGNLKIPLDNEKKLSLNYLGSPNTFQYLPYHDVLANKFNPYVFNNKIVLVGVKALGLTDLIITPFSPQQPMSGIEMNAHIINNLLEQSALKTVSYFLSVVVIIILGTVAGLVFLKIYSFLKQFLIMLFLVAGVFLIGYSLFIFYNYKISEISLILSIILPFSTSVIYEFIKANISLNKEIINIASFYKSPVKIEIDEKIKRAIYTMRCLTKADFICYRHYDEPNDKLTAILCNETILNPAPVTSNVKTILASLPLYYIEVGLMPQALNNIHIKGHKYVLFIPIKFEEKYVGLLEFYYSYNPAEITLEMYQKVYRRLANELVLLLNTDSLAMSETLNLPVLNTDTKISLLNTFNQRVREDREFFEAILVNSHSPIFVCDTLGFIMFCNPQLMECCKVKEEEIKYQNIIWALQKAFPTIIEKWFDIWNYVFVQQNKIEVFLQGTNTAYNLALTPVKKTESQIIGVVGILTDVTDLLRQATTDALTNLYNKKYFQGMIYQEFNRAKRIKEYYFSLLLFDVDHFKSFNDTYGHQIGDEVLKMIGNVVLTTIRKTDISARYGGEEFIIILPATDINGAYVVTEKLRNKLAEQQLFDSDGNAIKKVTISIGVACFEHEDENFESIIERADKALYACKSAGRNCVRINTIEKGIFELRIKNLY